jgi:preprotein translocase subunit SecG
MILYGLVIAIHVIASLILIVVILLQAGRGGGLSETFGGEATQTILGTKTSVFLKRATEVAAVVYILTCLTLAVMTSHRGRSLVGTGGARIPMTASRTGGPAVPMPFADEEF